MPESKKIENHSHNNKAEASFGASHRLRILSYNIHTGLPQERMSEYVTRSWSQVLPSKRRAENLEQIAKLLSGFDLVALQEVDPGSLRSSSINQVKHLAALSGFPYWYLQLNRKIGNIAKFSNAVLCRYKPDVIDQHKLPGLIPGRGALSLRYENGNQPLIIIIMHLALGPVARKQQFAYVTKLIEDYNNVIIMGDFNCKPEKLLKSPLLTETHLRPVNLLFNTYPSWKPSRNIDHILVSPSVKVEHVEVLDLLYSDHLPVVLEVRLPHHNKNK